jgi:hypothetical protein
MADQAPSQAKNALTATTRAALAKINENSTDETQAERDHRLDSAARAWRNIAEQGAP